MKPRFRCRAFPRTSWVSLAILGSLLLSARFLTAQATFSAGPLRLDDVRTIYVAPSSGDFALLLRNRLEGWGAVGIVSKPEEADAILTCRTENTIVPAKVVVRLTIAEVTLVDRRSQKLIWKTTKSTTFDSNGLADEVIEQLKKDRRKLASLY